MRKILTQAEKDKKQKKIQIIVGIVLILVMMFSLLGYTFQGDKETLSNQLEYNKFKFIKQGEFWTLKIENFDFIFRNNPKETEGVVKEFSQINSLLSYSSLPLYVYSEDYISYAEIAKNFEPFVERIQQACLDEKNCLENFPIKTCEDNLIIIKKSENAKISQDKKCVFIEGPEEELIKISDEFLFKVLKIKQ